MTRKLSKIFGLCLFMTILFLGCRSENDFVENNVTRERAPQKFYIFETKNNSAFYSKNGEGFDYANAFGYMAQRFDSINKTNITGLINTENLVIYKQSKKQFFIEVNNVPYIEFRIHSQPVIYDNQDVVMMYPKINEGIVIELVVAVLTDNETQLHFKTLSKDNKIFTDNISKFQQIYDRNFRDEFQKDSLGKNILSGRGGDIEEVVIIVIRDLGSGPRVGFPSSGIGQGQGGGCGGYHMCQPPAGEGGGGGEPNDPNLNQTDPCAKAQVPSSTATLNSKAAAYTNAQTAIVGMNNGLENGVVLGNVNGTIEATGVQTGGTSSIENLTSSFSNPIGDIHNHPNNNPPSPGDLYSLINIRNQFSEYNTRYVVTQDGTTYALIVTDPNAMNQFQQLHPPSIMPNSEGGNYVNFPNDLLQEWNDLRNTFSLSGALAFILNKYNSGVALAKMDSTGNFRGINVPTTQNSDGTTNYNYTLCPN